MVEPVIVAGKANNNQIERGNDMAETSAEKRARLEKRLAKLTGVDQAAKLEAVEAKIKGDLEALTAYKDYEGRLALWDVQGSGKENGVKVRVMIN